MASRPIIAEDIAYLRRCAHLAGLADSRVRDNPRVGAVLVYQHRIIGEGYHQRAGEAHAEVNCLASVAAKDRASIPLATLYISLEPCCITGRTGACTDLIRREGISTVVFAQRDTTPGVDGQSVALLTRAGITVREYPDFAPTLAVNAHRRVLTTMGRPRIILKYAQSADGLLRPANRREKYWITGPVSRRLVHRWRADTAAVLIGGRTVVEDDPALTTRLFPGPDPRPVIIDLRDRCTGKEKIFQTRGKGPLLFTGTDRQDIAAEKIVLGPDLNKAALTQVLTKLKEQRYGEVTVEGGAGLLRAFLSAGYWDEARIFTGRVRFGQGVAAPSLPAGCQAVQRSTIGDDLLEVFINPAP